MKIGIAGTGRLGLCLALNLESSGFNVLCYDIDKQRVDDINNKCVKTPEPFVEKVLLNSKIQATNDGTKFVQECDLIFVVIQTPSFPNGKYNHDYIDSFINTHVYENYCDTKKHLVINSTVYPGYTDNLNKKLNKFGWTVSYNPEFIAQGSIMLDQLRPDMVLIGSPDENYGNEIKKIYEKMCENSPRFCIMSPLEAEITKLALNCFLTTKISYANMVGDICKKVGANPDKVLEAVGSDSRIGNKYLKYGYGFGGPCFPRDNRALALFGGENGIDAQISIATDLYNELHLKYQIDNFIEEKLGIRAYSFFKIIENRHTVVLEDGVAYKKGTDLLTESQQLQFAIQLQQLGFNVEIVDRKEILDQLQEKYPNKFVLTLRKDESSS